MITIQTDKKNLVRDVLAFGWSIFAMAYIAGVTFSDIPNANVRIVDTIVGFVLGTIVPTIIYFFFGSSKGSQDKDQMRQVLDDPETDELTIDTVWRVGDRIKEKDVMYECILEYTTGETITPASSDPEHWKLVQ